MTIQLVPITQLPFPTFVEIFNQAYGDYFIPIRMEVEHMQRLVKRDQIDLESSVIALDDDLPIGVGMLAVNQHTGWIGGLGVIPAYRGQGIGRQITEHLLETGRFLKLQQIYLEVIERNLTAATLYQSLNFEALRRLLLVEALPQEFEVDYQDYRVEDTSVLQAISYYARFHPVPNPWQRRFDALLFLEESMDAWIIRHGEEVLAYAVGWMRDEIIRFMDIGMADGAEEALTILLQHIHTLAPFSVGSISNLPENDGVWQVMQQLHYRVTESQQEMRLVLT